MKGLAYALSDSQNGEACRNQVPKPALAIRLCNDLVIDGGVSHTEFAFCFAKDFVSLGFRHFAKVHNRVLALSAKA